MHATIVNYTRHNLQKPTNDLLEVLKTIILGVLLLHVGVDLGRFKPTTLKIIIEKCNNLMLQLLQQWWYCAPN